MLISKLCDKVTVTPEDNKTIVFNSGTSKALIGFTPVGGQILLIIISGLSLKSKNLQKKEKKNITSEKIKSNIPQRILIITILE